MENDVNEKEVKEVEGKGNGAPFYLYTVYDDKTEEFAPPFVAKNDKAATRMFLHSIDKLPYKEDMSLFKIAKWFPNSEKFPVYSLKAEIVPLDMAKEV